MPRKSCDYCIVEHPASTTIELTLAEHEERATYRLNLCAHQAMQMHLALRGFLAVATEVGDYRAFPAVERRTPAPALSGPAVQERRRAEQVLQAQQDALAARRDRALAELPPNADRLWRLTPHAKQRAGERGHLEEELLLAAALPAYTRDSIPNGTSVRRVHVRGDVACVVEPSAHVIVTVLADWGEGTASELEEEATR